MGGDVADGDRQRPMQTMEGAFQLGGNPSKRAGASDPARGLASSTPCTPGLYAETRSFGT
jgi:hypothetical protein